MRKRRHQPYGAHLNRATRALRAAAASFGCLAVDRTTKVHLLCRVHLLAHFAASRSTDGAAARSTASSPSRLTATTIFFLRGEIALFNFVERCGWTHAARTVWPPPLDEAHCFHFHLSLPPSCCAAAARRGAGGEHKRAGAQALRRRGDDGAGGAAAGNA